MRVGRGSGIGAWDGLVAGLSGLAMAVVVAAWVTQPPQPSDVSAATATGALVVGWAALAFRSTWPRAVVAVTAAAAAAAAGAGLTVSFVALPLAVYSLASTSPAWVSVVAIGGSGTLLAVGHAVGSDDAGDLWARDVALVLAAVGFGAWAQAHRRAGRRLAEAEVARREAANRLALARELHDLAAGTLTAVAVQAGAAAHLGERHPEAAGRMMGDVAAESRAAMAHLRRVAAALRAGEVPAPQPAAPSVDALVALYRRAGLDVRGSWDPGFGAGAGAGDAGHPDREGDVDAGGAGHVDGGGAGGEVGGGGGDVDRADEGGSGHEGGGSGVLVRLVLQEALTNVLRHAGRVTVDLWVRHEPGSTVVEVTNPLAGGGAPGARPGDGDGSGLLGLRERVELAGGTLEYGPEGASFRVRATLPHGA